MNNMMDTPQEVNTLSIIENMKIDRVGDSLNKISQFQQVVQKTLVKGADYGDSFPGAGKPSLLKPGAEKILMLLGLASKYEIIDKIQDYDEGFFAYTVSCILTKNGQVITEGVGHCNSKEKKYISEKQDIYMLGNTCLKMAKKRAQVDATLTVASLSNIFTQDLEDMGQFTDHESAETMTTQDALNMKLSFGKHKGQTLKEINTDNAEYIEWLSKNAKDNVIKKACKMVMENSFNQENNQEPEKQANENEQAQEAKEVCADCGKPSNIGAYTKQKYGRVLCQACLKKTQQTEDETIYEGTPLA